MEIEVVAGILYRDGKYLLAKRNKNKSLGGKWEFAGGKVENNESYQEALRRELLEEFGVDFTIGKFLGSNRHQYPNINIHLHAFLVSCHITHLASKDHEEVRWVKKDELLSYDLAEADIPLVNFIK